MENNQLRQLNNNVEVIGTLISKELEIKTSTANKNYITGKLVVQTKIGNRFHEQNIKVFVMESSKFYRGVLTVMNEYRELDRIKVTGTLKLCEYNNNQGNIASFNEIRGMYFTRLKVNDQPDKALASIETIVESYTPKLSVDGSPTGDYYVKGFTVGYQDEIIELKNVIIGSNIYTPFQNLYFPGTTGRLIYQLNNCVEQSETTQQNHGFGDTSLSVSSNTNKNYVSFMEIVAGDTPFIDAKAYNPTEISTAKQLRAKQLDGVKNKNNSSSISTKGTGFSSLTTATPGVNLADGSMPDF
ncbi:hypothetical protein NDK43_06740 [Neobacillus pocheonensis]|uniref:Uncharacterized protein n=1 Tax=Neobacillus pocheonensis TaxID=363869 RepID=A0ABT0W744_9BACI|nr:hypothetical protein [Neobacillus pocheonensis]